MNALIAKFLDLGRYSIEDVNYEVQRRLLCECRNEGVTLTYHHLVSLDFAIRKVERLGISATSAVVWRWWLESSRNSSDTT